MYCVGSDEAEDGGIGKHFSAFSDHRHRSTEAVLTNSNYLPLDLKSNDDSRLSSTSLHRQKVCVY